MLLDERVLERCGDAIAATPDRGVGGFTKSRTFAALLLVLLLLSATLPNTSQARQAAEADRLIASLRSGWPELYARLIGLERAHGVLYGALALGRGKVTESDVYRQMTRRIAGSALSSLPDPEADKGYAALGARGAEVIRRTHTLHREVLAIFASLETSDRERALDAAVDRYLSRPDVALPDVPKDMTILYDHPYTSFVADDINTRRTQTYPSLTGFVWASHWFQLAVQEPLEVFADSEARLQGLKVVTERFQRKLSAGQPPDAFPTELPLAPSISPGLVSAHLRAAAIIDNLNMMHDVLADVLVHPKAGNRRAAIDEVIVQFTDRSYRVVEVDDWITMALRHSIFAQGGPALGTMTQSDRNSSGHFQHVGRARSMSPGGMR
jgi:hypothetical protein